MRCEKLRQEFMEMVLGETETASPEVQKHVENCASCAAELAALRQTMSLLDEWSVPEPSPYFNTRLMARVREEAQAPAKGWMAWARRPAVAGAVALAIAMGVGLSQIGHFSGNANLAANDSAAHMTSPGTAVSDLQYLDKNADLFSEFDALDGQSSTE